MTRDDDSEVARAQMRAAAIEHWVNGDKPWANDRSSPYFMPWYVVSERALEGFIAESVKSDESTVAPQSVQRSQGQNNSEQESVN